MNFFLSRHQVKLSATWGRITSLLDPCCHGSCLALTWCDDKDFVVDFISSKVVYEAKFVSNTTLHLHTFGTKTWK